MIIENTSSGIFYKMWFNLRNEWYKTLNPDSPSLPTIETFHDEYEKYLLEAHKIKINYHRKIKDEPARLESIELLMSDEEATAFLVRWS